MCQSERKFEVTFMVGEIPGKGLDTRKERRSCILRTGSITSS